MNAPFRRPDIPVDVPDLGEMTLTLHYDVSGNPYARPGHPDGPTRGIGWDYAPRLKGGRMLIEPAPGKPGVPGRWLTPAELDLIIPRHRLDECDDEAVEKARVGA